MEGLERSAHRRFPFAPALKLHSKETHDAALKAPAPFIVVRLQDLLAKGGRAFKPLFQEIRDAGGLHAHLKKYPGKILLSFIMHNRLLRNCSPEMCAEAIGALKPDFSTTMDCESYLDRQISAKHDCVWCMERNRVLLKLCPGHKFIGLVKGASVRQVQEFLDGLRSLGITDFVLHVGDYTFRGSKRELDSAIQFARMARAQGSSLILYGISAVSLIRRFPAADAYVTQTHFLMAFKQRKRVGGGWEQRPDETYSALTAHNLDEQWREAEEASNPTGGLMQWVADDIAGAAPTQESGTAFTDQKRMDTNP